MLQLSFNDSAAFSAVDLSISGDEIPGFHDSQQRGPAGIVKSIFPTTVDVLGTVCATIRTSSVKVASASASRRNQAICAGHSSRIP